MVPKKSNQNTSFRNFPLVAAETEPGFGSIHSQTQLKKKTKTNEYDLNAINTAQPVQDVMKRITA